MSSKSREVLISEMASVMREFMAQAVLFQDAVAKWTGLNSVDVQCAGLLMLEGPLTPSELARRTGLTHGGAITAVIDRLEAAGLVHRTRDRVDRRRVLVTPEADVLKQRISPAYERVSVRWHEYLATLDDDQVALLTEAIRVAAAIDREEIGLLRSTSFADRSTAAGHPL
jgi:DNA-binding MarR family transcriptional regulator